MQKTKTENGTDKKPRQKPVPQTYERVYAGAMRLVPAEQAQLRDELTESVKKAVQKLQDEAKVLSELAAKSESLLNGKE